MSDAQRPPARPPAGVLPGGGRPGGGGFMGGMRGPAEKPKDFMGTMRRFTVYFRPRMVQLTIVFVFAVLSTVFTILGPKLMGHVTTRLSTA